MDKYIYDKNNGLWYERCGDYYLPCLTLPEQKSVGKWGQKYRAYLREHKREVYFCWMFSVSLQLLADSVTFSCYNQFYWITEKRGYPWPIF